MARTPLRADDPRRIGHYRLTARLGAGGMGVVYLGVGWDGSQVAVKLLRAELADDQEFRRRFSCEVAALVQVEGEFTVRVIEADSQSARPFVVTEYAEGPSLAECIDTDGRLGPEQLHELATGLAEALTVIHAAGITHRDLKPANIILTDAGPKVIDFGIAHRAGSAFTTKTGMMVGSLGFMAPEQINGHPGPAADIFAWGLTIGYAATGKPPFGTGNAHAILYRIVHGTPDIAAVPELLRPLLAAALAKDPEGRPTARQLLDRLATTSPQPRSDSDGATQVMSAPAGPAGSRPDPAIPPEGTVPLHLPPQNPLPSPEETVPLHPPPQAPPSPSRSPQDPSPPPKAPWWR